MERSITFLDKPGDADEVEMQKVIGEFVDAIRFKNKAKLSAVLADNATIQSRFSSYSVVSKSGFIELVMKADLKDLSYFDMLLRHKDGASAVYSGNLGLFSVGGQISQPLAFTIRLQKIDDNWFISETRYL